MIHWWWLPITVVLTIAVMVALAEVAGRWLLTRDETRYVLPPTRKEMLP